MLIHPIMAVAAAGLNVERLKEKSVMTIDTVPPIWETIIQISTSDFTERLPVPGGWLVCRISGIHLPQNMCGWFVNDPNHEWNPNNGKS